MLARRRSASASASQRLEARRREVIWLAVGGVVFGVAGIFIISSARIGCVPSSERSNYLAYVLSVLDITLDMDTRERVVSLDF
jgi:hypothetical protein